VSTPTERTLLPCERAAEALGVARQTFYHWFNNTMKLTKPLVAGRMPPALLAPLSGE